MFLCVPRRDEDFGRRMRPIPGPRAQAARRLDRSASPVRHRYGNTRFDGLRSPGRGVERHHSESRSRGSHLSPSRSQREVPSFSARIESSCSSRSLPRSQSQRVASVAQSTRRSCLALRKCWTRGRAIARRSSVRTATGVGVSTVLSLVVSAMPARNHRGAGRRGACTSGRNDDARPAHVTWTFEVTGAIEDPRRRNARRACDDGRWRRRRPLPASSFSIARCAATPC